MTNPRPTTIRLFEQGVILSQLMRIANVAAHLGAMAIALEAPPLQIMIGPFANALIAIGLALVIARGGFAMARWFLSVVVALDVIGLAGIPVVATMIGMPFAIVSAIAILLMLAAGVLMWLPASSAWLAARKGG
ncbi:MAG: hypothetical protein B7Y36_05270 [Novosphingobium sp. 28-62-57]|uniref:hypothetical protein n=1 Tax=unclassified Novosphingobium TaxID=2644732 RepID=UPI000BD95FA6|nr:MULTISPECIES: hypothetical protein [unclassified Novosphingobium]OYW50336.1 MAG: hypothetical protein B7Z34_05645 [Novosphingobium sp. 12-62-10]OYZ11561.1 MAG: hypothetical protein B7Y36_05270 [Novosphingobium sp. 28-62-57]OZA31915.1 MAG: hypothetical protein B7X92_13220 [Novosphingobium sp. 17-62-9]HQS71464.1 hypothetical protein [Novosphingobium sp.]